MHLAVTTYAPDFALALLPIVHSSLRHATERGTHQTAGLLITQSFE